MQIFILFVEVHAYSGACVSQKWLKSVLLKWPGMFIAADCDVQPVRCNFGSDSRSFRWKKPPVWQTQVSAIVGGARSDGRTATCKRLLIISSSRSHQHFGCWSLNLRQTCLIPRISGVVPLLTVNTLLDLYWNQKHPLRPAKSDITFLSPCGI
jgi:hypothetical protein